MIYINNIDIYIYIYREIYKFIDLTKKNNRTIVQGVLQTLPFSYSLN